MKKWAHSSGPSTLPIWKRNCELSDELAAAVGILNRAGIEPVQLNGAIRLIDGLYPDHGWRMLRDLGLLLPRAGFVDGTEALLAAGYVPTGGMRESVPVRQGAAPVEIELHRELFFRPREVRLLQAREMLDASRPAVFGDPSVRLPSTEHQVVHLIGHSQLRRRGHTFGRLAWARSAGSGGTRACKAREYRLAGRAYPFFSERGTAVSC